MKFNDNKSRELVLVAQKTLNDFLKKVPDDSFFMKIYKSTLTCGEVSFFDVDNDSFSDTIKACNSLTYVFSELG